MEQEENKVTSVFIKKSILEHAKRNPVIKNLSEWINEKYMEQFMRLDFEEKKLEELKLQQQYVEQRIEMIKGLSEQKIVNSISFKWIKTEGLSRAEDFSIESVLRFFNNEFGYDLNKKQFRHLLEKAKDGGQ